MTLIISFCYVSMLTRDDSAVVSSMHYIIKNLCLWPTSFVMIEECELLLDGARREDDIQQVSVI